MATFGRGAVVTGNIQDGAVTSAKIADGTIVNDDISSSAAIAASKLDTGLARLVGTLTGSTTSASEEEIATLSVTAGTFATTDAMLLVILAQPNNATNLQKIRITATSNGDTTIGTNIAAVFWRGYAVVTNRADENTSGGVGGSIVDGSGNVTNFGSSWSSMSSDWITGAFTISLRASVGGGATSRYRVLVYKMGS